MNLNPERRQIMSEINNLTNQINLLCQNNMLFQNVQNVNHYNEMQDILMGTHIYNNYTEIDTLNEHLNQIIINNQPFYDHNVNIDLLEFHRLINEDLFYLVFRYRNAL
jgi:hypothetical protein